MNTRFNEGKNIEIDMVEQLKEAVDAFETVEGEIVNNIVTSPAQKHRRENDAKCEKLKELKYETFCSIVQKYYTLRREPDRTSRLP